MKTSKKKQFVVDSNGKQIAVLLDIETYKKMEDALDDYYCRKEYDRVKKHTDAEVRSKKFVTLENYMIKRNSNGRQIQL